MNETEKKHLAEAVSCTFENMAFVGMEPSKIFKAKIPIKSPVKGEIIIFAPFFLLEEISQSIYSIEIVDINEKLMQDVIAEFANTAAGHFMESYLEGDQIFELGVPETEVSESIAIESDTEICFFKTVNSIIGASVKINGKEN
jgi:CheY-specific phosphatase CheX